MGLRKFLERVIFTTLKSSTDRKMQSNPFTFWIWICLGMIHQYTKDVWHKNRVIQCNLLLIETETVQKPPFSKCCEWFSILRENNCSLSGVVKLFRIFCVNKWLDDLEDEVLREDDENFSMNELSSFRFKLSIYISKFCYPRLTFEWTKIWNHFLKSRVSIRFASKYVHVYRSQMWSFNILRRGSMKVGV